MKLIIAIIQKDDEKTLTELITSEGFMVTVLPTSGGFLKKSNSTLLIGAPGEKVTKVINLIKKKCGKRETVMISATEMFGISMGNEFASPYIEAEVGGATIFVVDVEKYEKI